MDNMISNTAVANPSEESIYICLMEQSLEGVMFHNYNIDVFDVLDLCGFKKLHMCQYQDENADLESLKHEYIDKFKKIPILTIKTSNLWDHQLGEISEETIPALTKNALAKYYDWENHVLENLLNWRKNSHNKKMFQCKIKDVMEEIERLETILDILEEHQYNYECIKEMSNFLYK